MKMYFLSDIPCALFFNGEFQGRCDGFPRFVNLSLKDGIFISFQPENALPLNFFLTDNIRFSPPAGCEIYLLDDAIAIYARKFPTTQGSYKVWAQRRFGNTLFTLFSQGAWQVAVNADTSFILDELPFPFVNATLCARNRLVFLECPRAVAVYSEAGKRLLCLRPLAYAVEEDTLTVRLPYLTQTYALREDDVTLQQTEFNANAPLAYAFFYKALMGDNFKEMLCDGLIGEMDKIRAYLGDFCAVEPTDDPLTCALIYKRGEGVFSVTRYTIKEEEGKITDILS